MPTSEAIADRSKSSEAGFTLVEMLVAMLLLGLVGLTLARFQTFQLAGTAGLATSAAARVEADNLAIDALIAPGAPLAEQEGSSLNAGRQWHWRLTPGPSPDPGLMPDLVSIGIDVSQTPGGPILAHRMIVRPRGQAPR